MSLRSFYVVLGVMICLQQLPAEASPPMNIRKLYESASGIKFKKDETPLSVPDEDVLELEQLKQKNTANGYDDANQDDTLPPLERLLEYEATKSAINLGQPEEEGPSVVQHRPQQITPPQSTHDFQASNLEPPVNVNVEKAPIKPFYGAARLAFGQNPEIITTASTTTVTPSTTDAAPIINTNTPVGTASSTAAPSSTTSGETDAAADTLVSELEATKNGERRSVDMMPPKTAESLLKHKDGQYSSFDMAQYVFWTGDEAGVARAVEEFIQQGLMSRETAIKFLRDIRLGIEYLQSSYTNRIIPDHMKPAASYMISPIATTTHAPPSTTTEKQQQPSEPENLILTPNLQKALEGIPSLLRLQEVNNARSKDNSLDYDEMAGRMRVADFLYAEYSLEEVIYQLAKVMFSQSLTHGSEQSQRALQRLTAFLESEGEHGRISPGLQKKILDVLLAALSDTLAEHPELLAAARAELGNSFHKLPKNILDPMKN